MKRRDLMRQLRLQASLEGEDLTITEGGNHTKVRIADRQAVIPRHREINELTARAILRHMGAS